jgi:hypothetical protein
MMTGDAVAMEARAAEPVEPVLPTETVEGAELAPAPPAGEMLPTATGRTGGEKRGLQGTLHRLMAETYCEGGTMAGAWFHASDCERLLTQAGMTTTTGTVKTLVWMFGQQHKLEKLRVGNARYFRVAEVPLRDGQALPTPPARPRQPRRPRAPTQAQEAVTTTAAPSPKDELLGAVDRACADLGMLVAELVAETKQQLRKQIEGRLP